MIIVTGAAGFIGSNLLAGLNRSGYRDIVLVDDFSRQDRERNYLGKEFTALLDRGAFPEWVQGESPADPDHDSPGSTNRYHRI